ncbi:MAG: hypothetical protein WB780_08685 [Candidatus Acidiferrales bacterium]
MNLQATAQFSPQIIAGLIAFVAAVGVFVGGKLLDARSVNHAILAEIRRLLQVVESHRDWWAGRVAAGDTNYPLIPFSHAVYTAQVQNVGILRRAIVVRAVQFYGYLDFLNSLQALRAQFIAAGKAAQFDAMYADSLESFVRAYANAFTREFAKLR